MFEKTRAKPRIMLSILVAAAMVLSALPVVAAQGEEGPAAPRVITDDSMDLIVPEGETYELSGCHTYKRSVQINGVLAVKPYDGNDPNTGMLWLTAPNITVGPSGSIQGDGRGYGGGGGGTCYPSGPQGGKGGVGGKGGDGANPMYGYAGGGGGGSNGGLGGAAGSYGYHSAGKPGTETGGGEGGGYSGWTEPGGKGGTGYGGGGGGGGTDYYGSGGGGGGGSGGKDAPGKDGGKGDGSFGGAGGPGSASTYVNGNPGKNGGYMETGANGDWTIDLSVVRGSGGGGGGTCDYGCGGGGGGGAGGAAVTLIASSDLKIMGSVSTTGGGGAGGGMYYGGNYPGGKGGGGAGGGIALSGIKVTVSGIVNALGRDFDTLSASNGGTVKLLYADMLSNVGSIQAGRTFINGRPKMKGLDSPLANAQVVRKPMFKWNTAVDPESDPITYEIELASNPAFSPASRKKADIKTTNWSFDVALAGTLYWHVRAADRCGPGAWSEARKFIVDDKTPVSRIDAMPEFTTTQEFTVGWSGQDNEGGSGIAYYTIKVSDNGADPYVWLENFPGSSGTFVGMEGHSYRFWSLATDFADNMEGLSPDAAVTTTIDSVAPVATITAMNQYQPKPNFVLAWTGRDTTSGIADYTVLVSVDGADFTVWQDNTTESAAQYQGAEGHKYTFIVLARDIAGNVQPMPGPEKQFWVCVDGTPPATAFSPTAPSYGMSPTYIRPTATVYLNGTDNFAGVNRTFYVLDKQAQQEFIKGFRVVQVGAHNITYWSIDAAGNEEAKKATWFYVDGETPVTALTFIGPSWTTESRFYISAQTSVAFSATDTGSGVNRTVYNIDGSGWVVYDGPFKLAKSGLHAFKYHSFDNLQQEDAEKNASIVMDIWSPNSQALAEKTRSGQDVVVELRGTDLESGLGGVYYRVIKPGEPGMNFVVGTLVTIQAAADHSLDGDYTIEYYAVDNVGNKEETRKLVITIDTVGKLDLNIKGSPTVEDSSYRVIGSVEPGSKVTVNDLNVLVQPDGSFDYEMELKDGRNKIVVVSTDKAGNTVTTTKYVTFTKKQELGWLIPVIAVVVIVVAVAAILGFVKMRKPKAPAAAAPPPVIAPKAPPPVPPAK